MFILTPEKFSGDFQKIVYAISYIRGGHAGPWAESEFEKMVAETDEQHEARTWAAFEALFLAVFGRADESKWVANELQKLRQGKDTVEEYVAKFEAIAKRADLGDKAERVLFLWGLDECVKTRLEMNFPAPSTLAKWKTQSRQLDQQIRDSKERKSLALEFATAIVSSGGGGGDKKKKTGGGGGGGGGGSSRPPPPLALSQRAKAATPWTSMKERALGLPRAMRHMKNTAKICSSRVSVTLANRRGTNSSSARRDALPPRPVPPLLATRARLSPVRHPPPPHPPRLPLPLRDLPKGRDGTRPIAWRPYARP